MPRQSFLPLLEHRPDVCLGLMIVLCDRLRRTNEQVEDFAFLGLERRIAKLLLCLTDQMDQAAASRSRVKIAQRALAEVQAFALAFWRRERDLPIRPILIHRRQKRTRSSANTTGSAGSAADRGLARFRTRTCRDCSRLAAPSIDGLHFFDERMMRFTGETTRRMS